jgi:transcriptional regulator
VLKALLWGPRHGYAVARWIRTTSDEALTVEDRALYFALHRLEERGWVTSDWQLSENNRRAKVYTLTVVGRQQLRAAQREWGHFVAAVTKVLDAPALPA